MGQQFSSQCHDWQKAHLHPALQCVDTYKLVKWLGNESNPLTVKIKNMCRCTYATACVCIILCNHMLLSKKYCKYSSICLTRCNVSQFILSGNCSTWFGWHHHPSPGAQTTVSTASGICHTVTATCRYRGGVGTGLSVLWVAYATHSTLKPVVVVLPETYRAVSR